MATRLNNTRWGYAATATTDPDDASHDATALPALHGRPSLFTITSSRRVRLAAMTSVIFLALFALVHRYDDLTMPTWSRGTRSSSNNHSPDAQVESPTVQQPIAPPGDSIPVDWSQFAYTQYVTNSAYLCNSVMLFERLHHLGSRPDRVMMYPAEMLSHPDTAPGASLGDDARLLVKARDEYNVKLVPIQVQRRDGQDATWAESFTKLLAFNQTTYARILALDSDSTVLQSMDELFLLPPCPVAMPRAYWLYPQTKKLASHIMLLTPSPSTFALITARVNAADKNDYDMEILNDLFGASAMVLPHRPYALLTSEFRADDHAFYLGADAGETWDPVAVLNEAKFLHFSDWPVPKPWLGMKESVRREKEPRCVAGEGGREDCLQRDLWNGFYTEFVDRRQRVCARTNMKRRIERGAGS
ncbi:glycosyltransferase family 8 protein [Podospora appendiculata]|uniref:Glycosyltransferase family 8 protein n=1 Tax=Podospora appendiculata TaxID=314037 RepID=A0AAE0X6R2_9PEZI|nr:glycosyltransferase family 8 protein [Podospora appendiculata]